MTAAAVAIPQAPPSFLATGRGKLTLAFLCMVGFLDFVDSSITTVALPSIRHHLHFSVQSLQWVASGYFLTYGGLMLLGGRAADLLGRRRVLIAGTAVFGLSSLAAGVAGISSAQTGRLTKKIHRHPGPSESSPPEITPRAAASPPTAPQAPSARVRSAPVLKEVVRIDSAAGVIIAAPAP